MTGKEIAMRMLDKNSPERIEAEKMIGKKLEDMTKAEKTIAIGVLDAFQEKLFGNSEQLSMTYEDVKRIRQNPTAEDCDNIELAERIDEAIEKQLPKKPYNIYREFTYNTGRCPNCERKVIEGFIFCCQCGQALDWSDTE